MSAPPLAVAEGRAQPGLSPLAAALLAPLGLIALTVLCGGSLGGLIRPLFVLACGALGWLFWSRGPGPHAAAILVLFSFAPMARRVVDLSLGFDSGSLMLVGPLLAVLVTLVDLVPLLSRPERLDIRFVPLLAILAAILYTAVLTLAQGAFSDAASGLLKWLTPLFYAAALLAHPRRAEVLPAAAAAFRVVLPLMGLYGIWQYIDPPDWDRYWMQYASILSAGLPLPYEIRTFSTLNGPASFATFTGAGLLIVGFLRPSALSLLLMSPALVSFLLSQYRTAWIALALALLFCLLFRPTRMRAGLVLAGLVVAGLFAATVPPFSDVIADRLATLTEGSQDGSAQERLEQYALLWNMPDSSVAGIGFTTTDVGVAGSMAIDGMIIACWLMMGIPVGIVCLLGFVAVALLPVREAFRTRRLEAIVPGALALGAIAQFPLANLGAGELGVLFFLFAALVPSAGEQEAGG